MNSWLEGPPNSTWGPHQTVKPSITCANELVHCTNRVQNLPRTRIMIQCLFEEKKNAWPTYIIYPKEKNHKNFQSAPRHNNKITRQKQLLCFCFVLPPALVHLHGGQRLRLGQNSTQAGKFLFFFFFLRFLFPFRAIARSENLPSFCINQKKETSRLHEHRPHPIPSHPIVVPIYLVSGSLSKAPFHRVSLDLGRMVCWYLNECYLLLYTYIYITF